jgi:hypothetical protein
MGKSVGMGKSGMGKSVGMGKSSKLPPLPHPVLMGKSSKLNAIHEKLKYGARRWFAATKVQAALRGMLTRKTYNASKAGNNFMLNAAFHDDYIAKLYEDCKI